MLNMFVYTSIFCTPKEEWAEDLESIANVSYFNNSKNNLTGGLLFTNGRIIQILEGEMGDILKTFGRIKMDSRHREVNVVMQSPISFRSCEKWFLKVLDISKDQSGKVLELEKIIYAYKSSMKPRAEDLIKIMLLIIQKYDHS